MPRSERIIGEYQGKKDGPLLICLGALHGNEPAGVKALKRLFEMLDDEPIKNSNFRFKGRLIGIIGNMQAYSQKCRYIDYDLNRHFKKENIDRVFQLRDDQLKSEDRELKNLIQLVHQIVKESSAKEVYILDLHTTSSKKGIFSIPTEKKSSIALAKDLHAPVILGLLNDLQGTSMHYFNTKNLGVETTALTFESGHHNSLMSVHRAIAALVSCLRSIGCVSNQDVEHKHDNMLIDYSKDYPKVTRLIKRHGIKAEDQFKMRPNYSNFQKIEAGEIIADDKNGPIQIESACMILMPLYQKKGQDGFYLIKNDV